MYFTQRNARPFSYINFLAVKRAFDVQRPDQIYFYYDQEPENNKNWEGIKQYVTMIKIEPPIEFEGVELTCPQYQADIVRLQKLYEYGGIYLDTDMLLIKPLDIFLNKKCVMGGEAYKQNVPNLNSSNYEHMASISNAIIMCEPNNAFIKHWLERTPESMKKGIWAHHAVVLPLELYSEDQTYFDLQKVETFVPFDFRDKYIFGNNFDHLKRLEDSYTMHMWQTIWEPELSLIDDNYLKSVDNILTHMLHK